MKSEFLIVCVSVRACVSSLYKSVCYVNLLILLIIYNLKYFYLYIFSASHEFRILCFLILNKNIHYIE